MGRKLALSVVLAAVAAAAFAPAARALDLANLIAPPDVCAHQQEAGAPIAEQERAMRCMTNYARRRTGRAGLGELRELDRSAAGKSSDIIRCDSFSHYACGRGFTYWMQRVGYIPARCWRAGENIAWGTGELGTVRATFRAWVHSPGHRANILGDFNQIGIGLETGRLAGRAEVDVWTQHFGTHCGQRRAPAGSPRVAGLGEAVRAR
jgi:uncharacterized protein YkwD